jgi:hypothetical protein
MINATGHFDVEASMKPEFGECEKCKRNRLLRYEVRSDMIDLKVCHDCGKDAMLITAQNWGQDGKLTVKELC